MAHIGLPIAGFFVIMIIVIVAAAIPKDLSDGNEIF